MVSVIIIQTSNRDSRERSSNVANLFLRSRIMVGDKVEEMEKRFLHEGIAVGVELALPLIVQKTS
jgi:hypothetical protein